MDKVEIGQAKAKSAKSATNLPRNARERAEALVGLMGRMAAHIDRETNAVRAHRPMAELRALVKDKEPMSLVFEELSRLLRVDRDGMAALPDALKKALKQGSAELRRASTENAAALRYAQDGQRIVVDTLAAAANRMKNRQASAYAATAGGGRAAPRGYGPPAGYVRTPSSTFDTTL